MTKQIVMLLAAASIGLTQVACDSDGDGLKNGEERKLGLDPKNDDMDGDGLLDGEDPNPTAADADNDYLNDMEELAAGSDPNNPDTDDDGYIDGDEVLEGSSPVDAGDRIYKGRWPYNRFKDDIGTKKSMSAPLGPGDKFARIIGRDQNNDKVDLYDFAGDDLDYKYVIIDASAEWCGPCQVTAMWLGGGADYYDFESSYGDVRAAVKSGDIAWVTILTQDDGGQPAGHDAAKRWDDEFPNKKVCVIGDETGVTEEAVIGTYGGWPSGVLLKASTMKLDTIGHIEDAMRAANDYL